MEMSSYRPRTAVPHAVLTIAAVVASLGSFAILLAGFDAASPRRWLVPTPDIANMVAQCGTLATRPQRETCTHRVVATLLEHHRREAVLAQADGDLAPR